MVIALRVLFILFFFIYGIIVFSCFYDLIAGWRRFTSTDKINLSGSIFLSGLAIIMMAAIGSWLYSCRLI